MARNHAMYYYYYYYILLSSSSSSHWASTFQPGSARLYEITAKKNDIDRELSWISWISWISWTIVNPSKFARQYEPLVIVRLNVRHLVYQTTLINKWMNDLLEKEKTTLNRNNLQSDVLRDYDSTTSNQSSNQSSTHRAQRLCLNKRTAFIT